MTNLNEHDLNLLEKLTFSNQNQTKEFATNFLRKEHYEIVESEDYVIGIGEIPVALVSHMDTVFEDDDHKRDKLFYDSKRNVLWHPNGAGFDDKAGIFAIFKIIDAGFRPHVIFTTNEEIGCFGAEMLVDEIPDCLFDDLKYVIELDRANDDDCVFYDCINYTFIEYVNSFGFETAFGTSSDITRICPKWGVAGVNLSVGYMNQHTEFEVLNVDSLFATIAKVKFMLVDAENLEKSFKYSSLNI